MGLFQLLWWRIKDGGICIYSCQGCMRDFTWKWGNREKSIHWSCATILFRTHSRWLRWCVVCNGSCGTYGYPNSIFGHSIIQFVHFPDEWNLYRTISAYWLQTIPRIWHYWFSSFLPRIWAQPDHLPTSDQRSLNLPLPRASVTAQSNIPLKLRP